MATEVITAGPDTSLHEIASTLEKYAIKRVPIVRDGQLVGIVSRANLIQAVASDRKKLEIFLSDTTIRDKLLARLKSQRWAHTGLLNSTQPSCKLTYCRSSACQRKTQPRSRRRVA